MPNSTVQSFAKQTGKSTQEVETMWNETKKQIKDGGTPESDDSFYPKLVSALKTKLGIE